MGVKLRGVGALVILILMASIEAWAGCGCNPISMMNTPIFESFFPLGGPGVDDSLTAVPDEEKPFHMNLGIGVLYDSRVGTESVKDSTTGISDISTVFRFSASYKFPVKGLLGLRAGYSGYAQFFREREDFNVMNQSFIVEPNYTIGQGVFAAPFSFNSVVEDNKRDAYLYTVTPTYTFVFSDFRQAMSVYAIASTISDKDDNKKQNEDGVLWGCGFAYNRLMTDKSDIRLSMEFTTALYEAAVSTYNTYTITSFSMDDREDKLMTAGVKYNYRINSSAGLYTRYSFIHSTSNVELNNYDRNIIEVGISYSY